MPFIPTLEQIKIRKNCKNKNIHLTMLFGTQYYFRIESFAKEANYLSSNENVFFDRGDHVKAYNAMFDKAEEIYNKI